MSESLVTVCTLPSVKKNCAMNTGTTMAIMLGINRLRIRPTELTFSSIHSMMVVTSPMGENAPPAFAAITMRPANSQRSFWSLSKRRSIITMMMVVVMLSSTADMTNDSEHRIHKSCFLLLAWMCSVMNEKPP